MTFIAGTTAQLRVRWSRRDGSPLPRSAYERESTLYIRGVEADDAGDYACEAVDARSGAVVFTAVTALAVSGDYPRRCVRTRSRRRRRPLSITNYIQSTYCCKQSEK